MSDQTKIQTAGPVDPNAPARVKGYAVLSALLGLIPVLTVFKVITTDQGVAIGQFVQSGIGLAGAFGFAFVAGKTNKQLGNGTFDPPVEVPVEVPVVVPMSPVEKVNSAVQETRDILDGVNTGLGQLQDIVGTVTGLAAAAPNLPGPLDDLLRGFASGLQKR